jgi:hypothetical protein
MMWTRKRLREVIAGFEMENIELQTALDCTENELKHLRAENKKLIGLLFQVTNCDDRD